MGDKVRAMAIRAWLFLKGQRGAQTLEYIGLGILLLAILTAVTNLGGEEAFGTTLRAKFNSIVNSITVQGDN